jgi:hypothetical protein
MRVISKLAHRCMAEFRTVLTYSQPIDADVDRSMLRAEGIAANLLNSSSSLNGFGGPFSVQLQVGEEDFERASGLIRSKRPERFGRRENIVGAEAAVIRGTRRFLWFGAAFVILIYLSLLLRRGPAILMDSVAAGAAVVLGLFISIPVWLLYEFICKFKKPR